MKKKMLLGLGSFALVAAAFAGAVGARGAVVANAADDTGTWDIVGVVGGVENWDDGHFHEDAEKNTIVAELTTGDKIKLKYAQKWDISVGGTVLSALQAKVNGTDAASEYFSNADNAEIKKTGKYTFTLPSNYAEYGDKTWGLEVAFEAGEEPAPVAVDYYVVGDFTETPWAEVAANKLTAMGEESKIDGHTQYESGVLALHKDDELKVKGGANWYPDGDNYVIPADGNYKIYFVAEGNAAWENGYFYVANQDEPEPQPDPVYKVMGIVEGVENWDYSKATVTLTKMGEESKVGDYWQYESDYVTFAKDDKIKISDGTHWYPDGMDNEYVINEAGEYKIYFVAEGNPAWGGYPLFLAKKAVADVYKVTVGEAETTLEANPEKPGEYMALSVALAKDAVIAFSLNGNPLEVAVKEGEGNNVVADKGVLKVRSAGTGGIYLAQGEDTKWYVWVGGYVTPDVEVVNKFVADYITEQAKPYTGTDTPEARAASCKTKYDEAKAAYGDLTPAQQDLFNVDERYGDARAVLAEWEAAQAKAAARNSGVMADNGATIAIISIVSAGILAAGAMAYFARKRKAN